METIFGFEKGKKDSEVKILRPDTAIAEGGLPGDLFNSVHSVWCSFQMFRDLEAISEKDFRDSLRNAERLKVIIKEKC